MADRPKRRLAEICTEANAPQHDFHDHDHDHDTMAETTTNVAPVGDNADPSSQIASNANGSAAAQMSPHHATGAAAQVLETAELLDLILSKVELEDLLLRASLVCRGFKASIDSSPMIIKRLEYPVIDRMHIFHETRRGFSTCNRCIWLSRRLDKTVVYLGSRFDGIHIERYISSPSFRKLRIPNKYAGCVYTWLYQGESNGKCITGLLTPGNEDTVTTAELLEQVLSNIPAGSEVIEIRLWYQIRSVGD